MAKSRRARRAQNKIAGASEGALIEGDDAPGSEIAIVRSTGQRLVTTHLLSAEMEAVIDIIARDRVYRAMLAARGRRLLLAPPNDDETFTSSA